MAELRWDDIPDATQDSGLSWDAIPDAAPTTSVTPQSQQLATVHAATSRVAPTPPPKPLPLQTVEAAASRITPPKLTPEQRHTLALQHMQQQAGPPQPPGTGMEAMPPEPGFLGGLGEAALRGLTQASGAIAKPVVAAAGAAGQVADTGSLGTFLDAYRQLYGALPENMGQLGAITRMISSDPQHPLNQLATRVDVGSPEGLPQETAQAAGGIVPAIPAMMLGGAPLAAVGAPEAAAGLGMAAPTAIESGGRALAGEESIPGALAETGQAALGGLALGAGSKLGGTVLPNVVGRLTGAVSAATATQLAEMQAGGQQPTLQDVAKIATQNALLFAPFEAMGGHRPEEAAATQEARPAEPPVEQPPPVPLEPPPERRAAEPINIKERLASEGIGPEADAFLGSLKSTAADLRSQGLSEPEIADSQRWKQETGLRRGAEDASARLAALDMANNHEPAPLPAPEPSSQMPLPLEEKKAEPAPTFEPEPALAGVGGGESGAANIGAATLGAAPFIEKDLAPAAKSVATGFTKSFRSIRNALSPMSAGPEARLTGEALREHTGRAAQRYEQAVEETKRAKALFDHLTPDENNRFIDEMQAGRTTSNKDLAPIQVMLRGLLDEGRDRIRALGTGKFSTFDANYFPQLWQDPAKAESFLAQWGAKRPMETRAGFLKRKKYPTRADGIAAGLVPLTNNAVEDTMLRLREMNKYVMAHDFLKEMKDKGLAKFSRVTRKLPDGWQRLDDRLFTVTGGVDKEGALRIRGYYAMPEDAARIVNNYLSPGLRGNPVFDAARLAGNKMNQAQLGLSAFHAMFTGLDAATSATALGIEQAAGGKPLKAAASMAKGLTLLPANISNMIHGSKVLREYLRPGTQGAEIAKVVDALTKAGGRVRMDSFYRTGSVESFLRALREGNLPGATFRLPFAAVEKGSNLIMEHLVPRQKLGVFYDLMRHELDRLGPNATNDQVRAAATKVWDSVDNRMGQLVYDNLHWNKTLKDLGMVSTRSLGWNLGTIREVGGSALDSATVLKRIRAGDPLLTHRMAYAVALPLTVGLAGSVLHYLYNGTSPATLRDYFYIPTGRTNPDGTPERVQLPSYIRDIIAYRKHPITTISHKVHPLISAITSMLENQDYYGTEIRNPEDPVLQQFVSELKFAAKQFVPISAQSAQKRAESGASLPHQAESVIGISPVPAEYNRTDAENRLRELVHAKASGPRSEQDAEKARERGQLVSRWEQSADDPDERQRVMQDLADWKKKYGASRREWSDVGTALKAPDKFVLAFSRLSATKPAVNPEAFQVWKLANEKEREVLRPAFYKKLHSMQRNEPSEVVRDIIERARREGVIQDQPPEAEQPEAEPQPEPAGAVP